MAEKKWIDGGMDEGRGETLEFVNLWSCDATRDVDVQQMHLSV